MRISDWSSDVCSSDLRARGCDSLRLIARTARLTGHAVDVDRKNIVGRFRIHDRGDRMRRYRWGALRRQRKNGSGFEEHVPAPGQLDRKSVVSGKSVSVREALGVRRIIAQKKQD